MDRRSSSRCPVCQGPATADPSAPEGIRCRRSICQHNHADVACPRCKAKDLEQVTFENGAFRYTCRDCTHSWSGATTQKT